MDLIKVSGDIDFTKKLQEFSINSQWKDYNFLWDTISGGTEEIGKKVFEKIYNYIQNIKDINICTVDSLYSMAKELDVEDYWNYNLNYPIKLKELIDILSIKQSYLFTEDYVLNNDTLSGLYDTYGINYSLSGYYDQDGNITTSSDPSGNLTITNTPYINNSNYINLLDTIINSHLIENGDDEDYQDFLTNIYYDPDIIWSDSTSGDIIDSNTKIIRNICVQLSHKRENLKDIVRKHSMIGTNNILEVYLYDYILRNYTKRSDWNLYVQSSGLNVDDNLFEIEQVIPYLNNIPDSFNIQVTEYWDSTEYLNISAESAPVCGIIDYTSSTLVTSDIDVSGNLITGEIIQNVPVYDNTGLCGYIVSGGNDRFWESSSFIDDSEQFSGDIKNFYNNIGLTGTLEDIINFQNEIYNTFSVSGYTNYPQIPDLTGTPNEQWEGYPIDQIPSTGWITEPTNLYPIQLKYFGINSDREITGDIPVANYSNNLYPTIAQQPFLWNLTEKIYEEFPEILNSILITKQATIDNLDKSYDSSGNIIDSWRILNHEYIGYQTQYEQNLNLDYTLSANIDIGRDGPFYPNTMINFIDLYTSGYASGTTDYNSLSADYLHIDPLQLDWENINNKISYFETSIRDLEYKKINQFSYDLDLNQYFLYKTINEKYTVGQLWVRYVDHNLPFPVSDSTDSDLQQIQLINTIDTDIDYILNSGCLNFGFIEDTLWIAGKNLSNKTKIYFSKIGSNYFSNKDKTLLSVVTQNNTTIPKILSLNSNNYIDTYNYNNYIVTVSLKEYNSNYMIFQFDYFDNIKFEFDITQKKIIYIPIPSEVYDINTISLAASDNTIRIAFESENNINDDWDNGITIITLKKNNISSTPGQYTVIEHTNFYEELTFDEKLLYASDGQENDNFGYNISCNNNYLIVGSPHYNNNTGKSYIYNLNVLSDTENDVIELTGGVTGDLFGSSTAISDNNNIAIGYYGKNTYSNNYPSFSGEYHGLVSLYTETSGTFNLLQTINEDDLTQYEYFGYSLDMSDDYLIVSAPRKNIEKYSGWLTPSYVNSGKIYIYKYNGSIYEKINEINNPENESKSLFGFDIKISNNYFAVSYLGNESDSYVGGIYLYKIETNDDITFIQKIQPTDTDKLYINFGRSFDLISENKLIVGAYNESSYEKSDGKVYIYDWNSNSNLFEQKQIIYSSSQYEKFGCSIKIINNGNSFIVGAYNYNESGAYLIYYNENDNYTLIDRNNIDIYNINKNDWFGFSITANNNSMFISIPNSDKTYSNQGQVYYRNLSE